MIQNEQNRVAEHSPFNRPLRIAETIAFHQERASFWLRCAGMARTLLSQTERNAHAQKHLEQAKLLEFELNDNQ
tara:strand:+ start:99 stop:320 length:222 start_codon:yes stop_codon:yes gene_type:complete